MAGSSQANGPSKGYKIKLYKTDNVEYEGAFNDLAKEELGEVGYYREDPRLFHYPDGAAGVFIERTGSFYKLTEIEIQSFLSYSTTKGWLSLLSGIEQSSNDDIRKKGAELMFVLRHIS